MQRQSNLSLIVAFKFLLSGVNFGHMSAGSIQTPYYHYGYMYNIGTIVPHWQSHRISQKGRYYFEGNQELTQKYVQLTAYTFCVSFKIRPPLLRDPFFKVTFYSQMRDYCSL